MRGRPAQAHAWHVRHSLSGILAYAKPQEGHDLIGKINAQQLLATVPHKCFTANMVQQPVHQVPFMHSQVIFKIPAARAAQLSQFNEDEDSYELLSEPIPLDASKLTVMLPLHKATNILTLDLRGHCLN